MFLYTSGPWRYTTYILIGFSFLSEKHVRVNPGAVTISYNEQCAFSLSVDVDGEHVIFWFKHGNQWDATVTVLLVTDDIGRNYCHRRDSIHRETV